MFVWGFFLLFTKGFTPLQTVGGTSFRKDLKRPPSPDAVSRGHS